MIQLTFDLTSGAARLAQTAVIKLGAEVPVRVTFTAAPGEIGGIQLALGSDAASPALLAFTEDFTAENATTWTALLDASDSRLAAFMSGQGPTGVNLELACLIDGRRRISPNLSATVQPAIIPPLAASEGGPTYYTDTQTDAAIAAAIAPLAQRNVASRYRFKSDGAFQLWNPTQSKWHSITLTGSPGAEALSLGAGELL